MIFMTQSKNRSTILGLFRSMKSGVQKAIVDGYFVGDDQGKLNLLKRADERQLFTQLQRYWTLQHGCELPDDQELLRTRELEELFTPPEKTPRERRNSTF
jgi:hypothetical protein